MKETVEACCVKYAAQKVRKAVEAKAREKAEKNSRGDEDEETDGVSLTTLE